MSIFLSQLVFARKCRRCWIVLSHHILILPKSYLVIASYTQPIAIYDASPYRLIIISSYPCSPQRPGYEQSRGANTVRSRLRASDDGLNRKSGSSTKNLTFQLWAELKNFSQTMYSRFIISMLSIKKYKLCITNL